MHNLLCIKENPYIRFGYIYSEIDNRIADKYGIIDRKANSETRDEFFKRIGVCPNENEYGYRENFDLAINSDDEESRLDKIFESGYWLNRFVCGSYLTKVCAAKHGYCLDKLINDENWRVRMYIAEQGYGLDRLVDDESCFVREAVARQGYGLNKLVNDKDSIVRMAVAKQGYGLDILVNDKDDFVRIVVAEHGYGLEKLVNDEDKDVREAAKAVLK